jgi:hypothetical protein
MHLDPTCEWIRFQKVTFSFVFRLILIDDYSWLDVFEMLPHFRDIRSVILNGIRSALHYETYHVALNAYIQYIYKHSSEDIYSLAIVRQVELFVLTRLGAK